MSENLVERIRLLALQDRRYSPMAYVFVFEALDHTVTRIAGEKRHVTGRELLDGVRDLAIRQFGPMARLVFREWGITRTEDFGHIVFNLVKEGLMGKTENDSLDDFKDVFQFEEAFSLDNTVQLSAAKSE